MTENGQQGQVEVWSFVVSAGFGLGSATCWLCDLGQVPAAFRVVGSFHNVDKVPTEGLTHSTCPEMLSAPSPLLTAPVEAHCNGDNFCSFSKDLFFPIPALPIPDFSWSNNFEMNL